jgi:transposase
VEALRRRDFRLIFLDETGINTALVRRYGWAPKGERVHGKVPRNTPASRSVIGALAPEGLLAVMEIEGAVDGKAFTAFAREFLAPQLGPGDVVIMDNNSTHLCEAALQAIESTGAWVMFQPTYSPELNPIEHCWSKLKELLRKASARTHSALSKALRDAISQITPSDAKGWFEHIGYWVPSK